MMVTIEEQADKALALLRSKITQQGFTQSKVQEALGWGRSYISQLINQKKELRFTQLLSILSVIEVDPAEFFAELYRLPLEPTDSMPLGGGRREEAREMVEVLRTGDFDDQRVALALAQVLVEKGLLQSGDLISAVLKQSANSSAHLSGS